MTVYYKATRPDGTDFRTGTVNYAGSLTSGQPVMHPNPSFGDASGYLSVSVEPAETLIGGSWPCRLFEVEPIGEARSVGDYPHKRAVLGLRVVREVEAWRALGPQGEHVGAFIERIPELVDAAGASAWDAAGASAWDAAGAAARTSARDAAGASARDAAGAAAWDAAGASAWTSARDAAWDAARAAAWASDWTSAGAAAGAAAWALTVRDLITPEHFSALALPWKILTGEEN